MRKAQIQIDEVVGRTRLPTGEDRDKLPYIRAIVREVCDPPEAYFARFLMPPADTQVESYW